MVRCWFFRVLNLVLVLSICLCASAEPIAQHVFIVSLDGGAPKVLQECHLPNLEALVKEGAGTWNAQTILPSVTLISHTSMLTGVQPAKHGIDWNGWAPEKGSVTVPTVFSLAKAKGYSTAMFVGKEKLKHIASPGSVDVFQVPSYYSRIVAEDAVAYIKAEKPNLCFIHCAESDGAGHEYGWGSREQKMAFGDEDMVLGMLRQALNDSGIAGESVVIVTADHGGHDKGHGSDSPEDMTIPWIVWGKGVKQGFTITDPVLTCDSSATALWVLDVPIPEDWDGKPVVSAFEKTPDGKPVETH